MPVLLDECLPRRLKNELVGHDARTAPEMGWASKKNGELLALAAGEFDIFVTSDRNSERPQFASAGVVGRLPSMARRGYIVITMPTKTRIVRIGNSRGIRIPKTLLDEANLPEEVELHAQPGRLVVQAARHPRTGWAAAAKRMSARGDDRLLDESTFTAFDRAEWEWQ